MYIYCDENSVKTIVFPRLEFRFVARNDFDLILDYFDVEFVAIVIFAKRLKYKTKKQNAN